jgi:hypothetical protein
VVRHLQHANVQPRVRTGQCRLCLRLHVTGQQHAHAVHLGEQHQARVVGRRPLLTGTQRVCAGPEHLPGHGTHPIDLALRRNPHRHARLRGGRAHGRRTARRVAQPGRQHLTDVLLGQHPLDTAHVVGVEVGQHQHGDGRDPQAVEATEHRRRFGAGVDDDRPSVAGVEHQAVALADVARHHHPAVGWPPRRRQRAQHDQRQHDDRTGGATPSRQHPPRPPAHTDAYQGEKQQRQRLGRPADRGRGQASEVDRDQHDPAAAPPGHQPEQGADRRDDEVHESAHEPEHGGRRHHRRHGHVGDHGDETDLAGQPGHHRRAGQLRRQGYGDRLRGPPRQPSCQPVAERRSEEQDAGRRQHRQREPGRHHEPGVDQEQHDRRDPERAGAAGATVAAERQQRHRTHRRRPHHARLRPCQHDEADHAEHPQQCQPAAAHADAPCYQEQEPHDERQVRA